MTARLSQRAMMISTALGLGTAASARLPGGQAMAANAPKAHGLGSTDSTGRSSRASTTASTRRRSGTRTCRWTKRSRWPPRRATRRSSRGSKRSSSTGEGRLAGRSRRSGSPTRVHRGKLHRIRPLDQRRRRPPQGRPGAVAPRHGAGRPVGGKRIAAPPVGATGKAMNLLTVAERYRTALEVGRQTGVVPELELWGRSKTVSRMGEAGLVLVEAATPDASPSWTSSTSTRRLDFAGIRMFNGRRPPGVPHERLPGQPAPRKGDRRPPHLPGRRRGPAGPGHPRFLRAIGFLGRCRLELFNKQYYQQYPLASLPGRGWRR